ncbi:hypothetical protein CI238_12782 [Colletotrichum incanum]|uniref:Uncharacterized protein n=1 Tax=Colletotrichum incanum TaxID=1573173 RepID=A0A166LQK4_COLIC|nr:hypothetical protein CI238_12782 [Colletotrichum incanum]
MADQTQGKEPARFPKGTQSSFSKKGNVRLFDEPIHVQDTMSAIRKRDNEKGAQALVEPNVGKRLHVQDTTSSKHKRYEMWTEPDAEPDAEAAEELIKNKYPRAYVMRYCQVERFLQRKRRKVARRNMLLNRVVPQELEDGREGSVGGPVSLALEDPRGAGTQSGR